MVVFLFIGMVMSVPFLALVIVLSLFAPSQRWVNGFIVLVWVACGAIWSSHIATSSRPDYNEGPGGGLGIALMACVTLGVVFGTVFYGIFRAWYTQRLADRAG
jgi:hypothetical protein